MLRSFLRPMLPQLIWGVNLYGVRWFGLQISWFTDWREDFEPYLSEQPLEESESNRDLC